MVTTDQTGDARTAVELTHWGIVSEYKVGRDIDIL
jgi:hypothetical protein